MTKKNKKVKRFGRPSMDRTAGLTWKEGLRKLSDDANELGKKGGSARTTDLRQRRGVSGGEEKKKERLKFI